MLFLEWLWVIMQWAQWVFLGVILACNHIWNDAGKFTIASGQGLAAETRKWNQGKAFFFFLSSKYLTLYVLSFLILEDEALGRIRDIMCMQSLPQNEWARQAPGSSLCDALKRWSEYPQRFHRLDETWRAVIWGLVCLAGLHLLWLWIVWSCKSPGWNHNSLQLSPCG